MQARAKCPDRDSWYRFHAGSLVTAEVDELADHLSDCSSCLNVMHSMKTDDLFAPLRQQTPSLSDQETWDHISEELIRRLHDMLLLTGEHASTESYHPVEDDLDFLDPPQQEGEIGRLGSYRLLKNLGSGGMGIVFLAEDVKLKRKVALKVIKPELAKRPSAGERFLREARAMASVKNEHIVAIYHVEEHDQLPYLVMELLEGETLAQRLAREGRLAVSEAVRLSQQLCRGLAAAHEKGLIHRDIKPENLWLTPTGQLKMLDFGLAKGMNVDQRLTLSGTLVGTPTYMSPEQARGEPADERSDLFSLGCVMYRMLTGKAPFAGKSLSETFAALETKEPELPSKFNPLLPATLSNLVLRCLEKNPIARFESAEKVLSELEKVKLCIYKSSRKSWITTGSAVAASLLIAFLCFQIIIRIYDQDGNKKAEIVITGKHNDGNGKKKSGIEKAKEPKQGAAQELSTAYDKLDNKLIPQSKRFENIPKELVAVLASPEQKDASHALAVSDNQIAFTRGDAVIVWDVLSGKSIASFGVKDRDTVVDRIVFHPSDEELLVISGEHRKTQMWNIQSKKPIRQFGKSDVVVKDIVFSPDGEQLVTSHREYNQGPCTLRIYDVADGNQLQKLDGHSRYVPSIAFAPNGKFLLSGSVANGIGELRLWNTENGKLIWESQKDGVGHYAIDISPDGNYAFSVWSKSINGIVNYFPQLWRVEHKHKYELKKHKTLAWPPVTFGEKAPYSPSWSDFSPNNVSIVTVDTKGVVSVWAVETGNKLWHCKLPNPMRQVVFSPDGRHVVASDSKGGVYILRLPQSCLNHSLP